MLLRSNIKQISNVLKQNIINNDKWLLTSNNLKRIIKHNSYVNNCKSNKIKDYNSLSYLITRELSQSDCIKLGTGIEKVLKDIITEKNSLINIKPKNKKGDKEKDHLFIDNSKKIVYYAELKSNLNLDTEKCLSTINKCLQIRNELNVEYPDYNIKMFLVGLRYYNKEIIPNVINKKYTSITDNVIGVNEYFIELNTNIQFETEDHYKEILNYLANKMFE